MPRTGTFRVRRRKSVSPQTDPNFLAEFTKEFWRAPCVTQGRRNHITGGPLNHAHERPVDTAPDVGANLPPTLGNSARCPVCRHPAHVGTISWPAETFGVLQCDGRAVTDVADPAPRRALVATRARAKGSNTIRRMATKFRAFVLALALARNSNSASSQTPVPTSHPDVGPPPSSEELPRPEIAEGLAMPESHGAVGPRTQRLAAATRHEPPNGIDYPDCSTENSISRRR